MKETDTSILSYENRLLQMYRKHEKELTVFSLELIEKFQEPLEEKERNEIESVFEKTMSSARRVFQEMGELQKRERVKHDS